jgi:hypothetical protein
MVELLGHRQPKGAATAKLDLPATAPHLDSTRLYRIPGLTLRCLACSTFTPKGSGDHFRCV